MYVLEINFNYINYIYEKYNLQKMESENVKRAEVTLENLKRLQLDYLCSVLMPNLR